MREAQILNAACMLLHRGGRTPLGTVRAVATPGLSLCPRSRRNERADGCAGNTGANDVQTSAEPGRGPAHPCCEQRPVDGRDRVARSGGVLAAYRWLTAVPDSVAAFTLSMFSKATGHLLCSWGLVTVSNGAENDRHGPQRSCNGSARNIDTAATCGRRRTGTVAMIEFDDRDAIRGQKQGLDCPADWSGHQGKGRYHDVRQKILRNINDIPRWAL